MDCLLLMQSLPWEPLQMRTAGAVLLVIYIAVVVILTPREVRFLNGVKEKGFRVRFIIQDILIQLSVLMVLVPCVFFAELFTTQPWPYAVIATGMILLWVSAIWAVFSRYSYTYNVLLGSKEDLERKRQQILEDLKNSSENEKNEKDD